MDVVGDGGNVSQGAQADEARARVLPSSAPSGGGGGSRGTLLNAFANAAFARAFSESLRWKRQLGCSWLCFQNNESVVLFLLLSLAHVVKYYSYLAAVFRCFCYTTTSEDKLDWYVVKFC